ncbi:MAG: hypothetical protein IJH75_07145 [Mogibacterium sp.]|nr:hypothetical protein [Mogibacterium sp.]
MIKRTDKARRGIRRLLVLLLTVCVLFTLVSCGKEKVPDPQDAGTAIEQETTGSDAQQPADNTGETGGQAEAPEITGAPADPAEEPGDEPIDEFGEYTTRDEVAEYIHTYHKLPPNYLSEDAAKDLGWRTSECPAEYGIMIGGRKFGNREKLLPQGVRYYECDVDYDGDRRGVNRLVYTADGTVYSTEDHYKSFTRLY